jgi:hypothetical protein
MRIFKNILIGLGALFGLLIVLAIVTRISSARFKSDQTAVVTQYATDLSRRWELADVYDRSSNSLVEQAATPQGQQAMQQLRAADGDRDQEIRDCASPRVSCRSCSGPQLFIAGSGADLNERTVKRTKAARTEA